MIRRPPRSTRVRSSAASDVYKRQHLTGSVELGPITGMAEAIVDLVATGKTLNENGLIKIDDLFYSTARLIGNPLSMRLDDNHLRDTILSIESINVI